MISDLLIGIPLATILTIACISLAVGLGKLSVKLFSKYQDIN